MGRFFVPYDEWLADLEAVERDDPGQVNPWIRDTLSDKANLHIFGRYFFPHVIQGNDEVPEAHIDLLAELSSPDDSAILFPRGFAKSTWEKVETIHDIVCAREEFIVYIAKTVTEAGFHFDAIRTELESNRLLKQVFGEMEPPDDARGKRWKSTHFETTNGVIAVATGRLKGRGFNIKNRRPTKIILDDVEDDDFVRNPMLREKLHRWNTDVLFPALKPGVGRRKFIGTAIDPRAEVVRFYNEHGGIRRQAIEDGKSIWPARFPLSDLQVIRDGGVMTTGKVIEKGIGTRAFNREYMNNPTASEETKIKTEWIAKAHFSELPPEEQYEAVMYIDPQAGEKQSADEYALTLLMRARGTPHRYCYLQEAGRVSQMDQARAVVRMWARFKRMVTRVGVEKVLNQTAVFQTLQDWKAGKIALNAPGAKQGNPGWIDETDRNIPIVACTPRGKDKIARLEVFEPDFERGEIHLRPEQTELQAQLEHPTESEHDDRMDSLVGALELSGRDTSAPEDPVAREEKKRYDRSVVGNISKKIF